jgi:hypothetical protein
MYSLLALIAFPVIFFLAARHEEMPNPWRWAVGSGVISLVVLRSMGMFFVLPAQVLLFVALWVYNTKHQRRRGEKWAAMADERRRTVEGRQQWAQEQMARERAERAERERLQDTP